MIESLNNVLSTMTPEQHDRALDGIKAALIAAGAKNCSIYLMTHKHEPAALCNACNKWWAISELEKAKQCPDCGNTESFGVIEPDSAP